MREHGVGGREDCAEQHGDVEWQSQQAPASAARVAIEIGITSTSSRHELIQPRHVKRRSMLEPAPITATISTTFRRRVVMRGCACDAAMPGVNRKAI